MFHRRVDFDKIKLMGHWEQQHVGKSYINEMPSEVCLQRAGHPIDDLNHYFLPRAQMREEEKHLYNELAELVFPKADVLLTAKKQVWLDPTAGQMRSEHENHSSHGFLCCAGKCRKRKGQARSVSCKLSEVPFPWEMVGARRPGCVARIPRQP